MTFPHGLPAIIAHYGNPFDFVDHPAEWESLQLATRPLRYPLPYAYAPVTISRVRAHRLVVEPLVELLAKAFETGVEPSRIAFGGTYAWRAKRGSTRLSTHTWGIAVDLDPGRNPQHQRYEPQHGIPMAVVDLFEAAGWTWGGRWSDPDPMHFQAAGGY